MSDERDFTLGQQIAEIKGVLETGFNGINRRLDILNGKVAEHEKRFGIIDNKNSYNAGREKGLSLGWGAVIGIAGLIVAVLTIISKWPQ